MSRRNFMEQARAHAHARLGGGRQKKVTKWGSVEESRAQHNRAEQSRAEQSTAEQSTAEQSTAEQSTA